MFSTSLDNNNTYGNVCHLAKVNTVKTINFNPMMPMALHASLTKLNSEMLANESTGGSESKKDSMLLIDNLHSAAKNKSLVIRAMADNHESLGKCVRLLSRLVTLQWVAREGLISPCFCLVPMALRCSSYWYHACFTWWQPLTFCSWRCSISGTTAMCGYKCCG